MRILLCVICCLLCRWLPATAQTPCDLVSTLSINTGYNHITGTLLTGGQRDTFWKVSAISAFSASMYTGIPPLPYAPYVIVPGFWPTRTTTSEWLSFIPAGTYVQPAVVDDDSMWVDYSRDFRLCSPDTLNFNLELVNDNYCPQIWVDGAAVPPASPFSQPRSLLSANFTMWNTITPFDLPLAAGTHRLTFRQHNFNVKSAVGNPTGMSVRGTISSVSAKKSILGYAATPGCSCSCTAAVKAGPHDTTVCPGAIIPLRASGADTYSWSPAAGLDNPAVANPRATVNVPARYVVTGTDASGCIGRDTIALKVFAAGAITVSPADSLVCIGARFPLKASGATGYKWSPGSRFSDSTVAAPLYTATQSERLRVMGTNSNGCSDTAYVNIVAIATLDIDVFPTDTAACIGESIRLRASGAQRYQWFPAAGIDNDTAAEPWATVAANIQYLVRGWDVDGCLDEDTVSVRAYPAIRVNASADRNYVDICNGNTVELRATGAESYTWSPGIYCDEEHAAVTKARPPYTLVFTVSGKDRNGCVSQDTITIFTRSSGKVSMPNSFTPNGDGLNDGIKPLLTCDFLLDEFAVYDRWGEQVFQTTAAKAWDGTYNGMPLNTGVYYYFVKGHNSNGESQMIKGDITLIR